MSWQMSPLNLSRVLSMAVNPLASHPDQVVLTSRAMWRIVLFRDRKRECQRAKGLFRAVIGMQDSAELPEWQNSRLSAQIRLGAGGCDC